MKKLLLLSLALTFATACSSPKEKYDERRAEAKEDYQEELKEAQEEYREENKDEAVDIIEDSDGVQINEDENQIKVQD